MELKPGYKRTEVGVIPDEWEVRPLSSEISDLEAGVSAIEGDSTGDHGSPSVLKTSAVMDGKFIPSESKVIAPKDRKRARLNPKAGAIIISRMNTVELVGQCGYVPDDYPTLFLPDRLWMTKPVTNSSMSTKWLAFILSTSHSRSLLKSIATGTSGSMKNISKDAFLDLKFAFPPTHEQAGIATVLSDVDALLEGLERLIVKKRDLQQAAMQQLLTGQTRLPGFTSDCESKTLGELGSTYGGLTGKTKDDFGQGAAQYVTFMNVISNVQIDCDTFAPVKVQPNESQNRVRKGDLLLNGSSETPEEVALCAVINRDVQDLFLNSFCFGFRFHEDALANGLFIAMYLRSREGREIIKSLAQGSTRYNLSKSALLRSSLRLPELKEQAAIAAVITDMDTELAALEERLTKTRDLKQAMMQELLTGKTRLVIPEAALA